MPSSGDKEIGGDAGIRPDDRRISSDRPISPGDVLGGLREHERERIPERYEILGELGRGGMAVVYRARDRQLDREVALKVLRDDLPAEPGDRARFQREAEAAAKISHPNVVTVLDAGPTFLVMELVRGRPFDPAAEDFPALEKVARAIHVAHGQGIVHRDLKPSNILMTESGEPKVADFGIARLLGDRTALTQSGAVMGTPQYMAPEQVQGRVREIGPGTDVYALGAILYEMLAGRPPHRAETPMELFGKIVNQEPAKIVDAPGDLETIAFKALEKEPSRRFASALEMAEDLRRCREGEPIEARPPSALYRLRKQLARRKGILVTGTFGLLAIAATLAIVLPRLWEAKKLLKLWGDVSVILADSEKYARAGEMERARKRLDEGIALCEGHESAEAHYFKGRLLRARGRADEALRELDLAISKKPELGEARFERGLLLVDRYGAMQWGILAQYAGRSPLRGDAPSPERFDLLHPELSDLRRRAMEDLSVTVGASAYFRPVDGEYGKAELERLRWNWDEARKRLLAVLGEDPLYMPARLSLARMAMMLEDYAAMEAEAGEAIQRHQGCGEAYALRSQARFWRSEQMGLSAESIRMRADALADAEQAVRLLEAPEAYAARGNVRRRVGEREKALEDYDRALAGNPNDAITLNHRGILKHDLKDLDGAEADFTASIRISPGYAVAYKNRAIIRLMKSDRKGAKEDAEKAVEVAPPGHPQLEELKQFRDTVRGQ